MDNEKFGIEQEQEALAEFDKIRKDFVESSPTEDLEESLKQETEPASGTGLGDGYADETILAAGAAEAADAVEEAAAELPAEEVLQAETAAEAAAETVAEAALEQPADIEPGPAMAAAPAAAAVASVAESKADKKRKKKEKKKEEEAETETDSKKKKKKKKFTFWKFLLILFLVVLIAVLGAVGYGAYYVSQIIKESPEINPSNIYDLLAENSVLLDSEGNQLTLIYDKDNGLRSNVDYAEIPENLKNAFIAIEDKTFWDHNGFNIVRIFGAVWNSAKTGFKTKIQGTSTITQQLARNVFISERKGERSMERKIREMYYTVLIERALSKEQILEAYLNTIYLGYNCSGVGAAAKSYFNKDVKELTLVECAALAALPQNPVSYAPLKRVDTASVTNLEELDIVKQDDTWVVYYNNYGEGRTRLVLYNMHEQGLISDSEYEQVKTSTVREYLNPGTNVENTMDTTYITDYVVAKVLADLQSKLNLSYADAYEMLYSGGLIIHSTIDMTIQNILDTTYADRSAFIKVKLKDLKTDKEKNIMNDDKSRVILYNKAKMFDENGGFIIKTGEFEWQEDGSLKLLKGKRLNIYNTKTSSGTDVAIYIKEMYYYEDEYLFSISGSYWNIASRYKTRDDDGNLIISASYFKDYPNAFLKNEDGTLTLISEIIVMKEGIIQPQSAAVVIENQTGYLRGMIGGREIGGQLLFNRATSTRQTGSSIKPLSVYSTALQTGYNNAKSGSGPVFTAAYPLDDVPYYNANSQALWPKNVYEGYKGITYLRNAVENSINTCAVNLYNQLDPMDIVTNLENMGITSLVKSGEYNDINPAALALGGQTNGISPLEMASAYSTFGNYGTHIETTCYTLITNRRGDVIIENTPNEVKVYDENVASLMLDILRTTVNNGSNTAATKAKLKSQPTAGKTGTTSDQYDIWFDGITPKYTASVWIGCDTNVNLGSGSSGASKLWNNFMEKVGELDPKGKFELKGKFVTVTVDRKTGMLPSDMTPASDKRSEIFISGTQPKKKETSRARVLLCAKTGYLATPSCPSTGYRTGITRPCGMSWEGLLATYKLAKGVKGNSVLLPKDVSNDIPIYYCPLHNPNKKTYPVSPISTKKYNTKNIDVIKPVVPDPEPEPTPTPGGDTGGGN